MSLCEKQWKAWPRGGLAEKQLQTITTGKILSPWLKLSAGFVPDCSVFRPQFKVCFSKGFSCGSRSIASEVPALSGGGTTCYTAKGGSDNFVLFVIWWFKFAPEKGSSALCEWSSPSGLTSWRRVWRLEICSSRALVREGEEISLIPEFSWTCLGSLLWVFWVGRGGASHPLAGGRGTLFCMKPDPGASGGENVSKQGCCTRWAVGSGAGLWS